MLSQLLIIKKIQALSGQTFHIFHHFFNYFKNVILMIPNGYNNRNNRRSLGRTTMTSFPSTFDLIKLFLLSAIWIFGIYNFSVNSFSFLSSFNLKNSFTNIFYAPEHQHDLVVDYSACKHLTVGENHSVLNKCGL